MDDCSARRPHPCNAPILDSRHQPYRTELTQGWDVTPIPYAPQIPHPLPLHIQNAAGVLLFSPPGPRHPPDAPRRPAIMDREFPPLAAAFRPDAPAGLISFQIRRPFLWERRQGG